jgi:hypothetical protein
MPKSANRIRRLPSSGSVSKMLAGLTLRCCVDALDVVHCDPQVAIELAAIMHPDDVRVPQRRGEIRFAVESLAEVAVDGHCLGKHPLPGRRIARRQRNVGPSRDFRWIAPAAREFDRSCDIVVTTRGSERRPLGRRFA